jgi:hypothetical protein
VNLSFFSLRQLNIKKESSQEVVQSVGTMPNETEVTSSNPPPPSCVDMSKKKKKKEREDEKKIKQREKETI